MTGSFRLHGFFRNILISDTMTHVIIEYGIRLRLVVEWYVKYMMSVTEGSLYRLSSYFMFTIMGVFIFTCVQVYDMEV